VNQNRRDLLLWGGGALLVVIAVLAWLFLSAPESNPLSEQYWHGVM